MVLSVIAWGLKPTPTRDGKTPLVWVSDNNPERLRQIKRFNELHPQYRLALDPNNSGIQKIIVQASSGVGPDFADSYGGIQLQTLADAGVAWDITDVAQAGGFSMRDKVWPGVVMDISNLGRQYSYPCNVNVDVLIYNKNVFDRLGVPYPKQDMDWNEFIELARQVTRQERNARDSIYGVTGLTWLYFFSTQRGEYFSEDGTRVLADSEPVRVAFQMHHDVLFRHRIAATSMEVRTMAAQGGWGGGAINQFAEGRFAMTLIGKWVLIRLRSAHADQMKKLERWEAQPNRSAADRPAVLRLGSVRLPHAPGQAPCYRTSSRSAVINARSPRRADAVAFLKYLAGPEYSRLLNEGVDALPGNPEFARLGLQPGVPDLAELELHENTVQAMASGYGPRRSPFLLNVDVDRVLAGVVGRMESQPEAEVTTFLADAQRELVALMQRNLNRDPELRRRYRELTGTDNVVEAHRRR